MNIYIFEGSDASSDIGTATVIIAANSTVQAHDILWSHLSLKKRLDLLSEIRLTSNMQLKAGTIYSDVEGNYNLERE